MFQKHQKSLLLKGGAAMIAALQVFAGIPQPAFAQNQGESASHRAHSPIKHVIVIIGENRSFDHVFATYKPAGGQTVDNLLSKGIINADGTPGPHYSLARQDSAQDTSADGFQESPGQKAVYAALPPPLAGGPLMSGENVLAAALLF